MIKNEEEWIKNDLIPKLIENEKLVEGCKDSKNFILRDMSIKLLSTQEAFMLTKCYKLKLDYEYNGKGYSNTLVVKKTPEIPKDAYKSINFDSLYHNEILAYTEIIPILNISQYHAKYYYSHRKQLEAVIVLGDFSVDRWKMTKSKVNLSLEHILLAVKAIAQFHGAGFALKQTDPKKIQEITSQLKEPRFVSMDKPEEWEMMCRISPRRTVAAAKKFQYSSNPLPDEFLDKLLKMISDMFNYCKKRVQPIEPIATICHGDYLRNNVAFKYEGEDQDVPTDIIMFDFQTLRYSSPMVDVCLFMCLSAGKDVRPKNFENIFKTYWTELTKTFCERTGTQTDNLPSYLGYDTLLKEYIRYLPYGVAIASSFLMALFQFDDYPLEDMMNGETRSEEEITNDIFTRGGEAVDVELSALVHELYQFTVEHNIDIFEGFL